jgi:predicted nucleic acid-binding protein
MPGPYWPGSVTKIATKRAHVILPEDVVAGIDSLVGKRGRSAFLAEVAREADVTVAAVALTHGLTLLTDNRKDFPMPELALYSLP